MLRSNTTLVQTAPLELSPFGLLSPAADQFKHDDEFWTSGITYQIKDAGLKVINASIMERPEITEEVINNTSETQLYGLYYPFDVRTSIKVSTMGTSLDDIEEGARNALDIAVQRATEIEFLNGNIASQLTKDNDNRYLSHSSTVDLTPTSGTGVKLRYGMALLEDAISSGIGAKGVIHATKGAAFAARLEQDGKTLLTQVGTPVVAGSGYVSNVGPGGVAASGNNVWLYGTGPVSVRRGKVSVTPEKQSQAVNTAINTVEYYVDQPVAITLGTGKIYAVLVDLTLDYS